MKSLTKPLDRICVNTDIAGVMNDDVQHIEEGRPKMSQLIALVWSGEKLATYIRRRGYESLDDVVRHLQAFVPPGSTISRQHLDNWTKNKHVPSMKFLPAFKYGLGIVDPVEELFDRREPS